MLSRYLLHLTLFQETPASLNPDSWIVIGLMALHQAKWLSVMNFNLFQRADEKRHLMENQGSEYDLL
tara:strand:+ start:343 stop:543 length:201 start_codon:yes stop_codon:yes gene_type:complete